MPKVIEKKKFVMSEVGENHNKVWQYEIYDDSTALVQWGRIGKGMQSKSVTEHYCHSKINEKLAKGYKEIQTLDCSDTVSPTVVANQSLKDIAKKQIKSDCPQTQKLIEYLTDVNAHNIYSASGGKITLDVNSGLFQTPLGIVTKDSINEARKLLVTLNDCVKTSSYKTKKMENAVNDYLMLIPQEVGHKLTTQGFLPDLNAISKQNDLLDGLEASYSSAIVGVKSDKKASNDAEPELFNVKLTLVEDKAIVSRIQKMYEDSRSDRHVSASLKVKRVYAVEIATMKNAFDTKGSKVGNIHELWHGTRAANLLSILKSGFIIPPENASYCTGRLYGNGVYFSSKSTKSLNYAMGYWDNKGYDYNCFMFLNKVAVGKYEVPGYSQKKLSSGYDSFWAQPNASGVMNDEIIVFNTNQINPIYLIEFCNK